MTLPFPIPIQVLYAGLAGVVLALIIATAQQRRCSVFFLLALRLAIGWHFLFEGLHKVNSYYTGPNEQTKVFTSEPYFNVAPGPLGPYMRAQFNDVEAVIAARVKAAKDIKADDFRKLGEKEQAEACPESVAKALDELNVKQGNEKDSPVEAAIIAAATTGIDTLNADEKKSLAKLDEQEMKGEITKDQKEAEAKKISEQVKKASDELKAQISNASALAKDAVLSAKAAYARWVYGVDERDTEVKIIEKTRPHFSAPERLDWIVMLRKQVEEADARAKASLGNGYGYEKKRADAVRQDLIAAEAQLAKDANDFVAELRSGLTGGKAPPETVVRRGPLMDKITMWFLVGVGVSLLAGLFTKLGLLAGAGFLVITYLNHPAFPWFVAPPGTEGNPLFINKNIIECLAMLALACFPTGRWMGLDALFLGVPRPPRAEAPPAAAAAPQPRSLQQPPPRRV